MLDVWLVLVIESGHSSTQPRIGSRMYSSCPGVVTFLMAGLKFSGGRLAAGCTRTRIEYLKQLRPSTRVSMRGNSRKDSSHAAIESWFTWPQHAEYYQETGEAHQTTRIRYMVQKWQTDSYNEFEPFRSAPL